MMKSRVSVDVCVVVILLSLTCIVPSLAKLSFSSNKIKHIIVLMEENRSFDHMLGWLKGVNGLKGNESNLVNNSNPNSAQIYVDDKAPYVAPCDPDHSTIATTFKLYGSQNDTGIPKMNGFVEWQSLLGDEGTNYCDVMSSQSPDRVPIMSALASEFVVMDRFFSDFPGPTWPNRLFMLTGTSAGCTSTKTFYENKPGAMYPQPTIFDQVEMNGLTWRNYFNDTPWEYFVETIATHPEYLLSMEHFYADAKTGDLPSFAWINPRAAINITLLQGSNDQHPDHDVALGERYIKDIYEALRASPAWNETLFVVTYDEFGGFFDHVPPPIGVPPPSPDLVSYPQTGVKFDRLGLRIPTLLISPWLPKGLVVSEPPAAQKPFDNSEYCITSIMATCRILLNMTRQSLTQRDAWAATFENLFDSFEEPRTDCPMHLPAAPPPTHLDEANLPVNELQEFIMDMHANLVGVPYPDHIQRQGDVSEWLQSQHVLHTNNMMKLEQEKNKQK